MIKLAGRFANVEITLHIKQVHFAVPAFSGRTFQDNVSAFKSRVLT